MNYAIYSQATGRVRQFVYCPEEEAPLNAFDGEGFLEVEAIPSGNWEVIDGQLREIPEKPPEFTYDVKRRAAYPKEGDQLDAIWKALGSIDPATLPADTLEMMGRVQAVKAQYPKPSDSN